jgi:sugar O-acyltransferase (sialic acid O-acetyltransferase NeuD family)
MSLPHRHIFVHRGPGRNFDIERLAATRDFTIVAYVDDVLEKEGQLDGGIPIIDFDTWLAREREIPNLATPLDPGERRKLAHRIAAQRGAFATIGRSSASIARETTFGDGTIVGAGILSVNSSTAFGGHVIVETPASIGHDCAIGDFVTIHASASISGYVTVADGVVIGAGAIIVNGTARKPLHLGSGAQICPGAVVTKSVPPGAVVAGNPARTQRA